MYLTYFDDTGGTGQNYADPQQPVQGLFSVSIDETKWRKVEHDCHNVVAKHFPERIEEFLKTDKFELHAAAIYQGTGEFRKVPLDKRLAILNDIVSIIVNHELPILGVYAEKRNASSIIGHYHGSGLDNLDDILFTALYAELDSVIELGSRSRHTMLIGDYDSMKPHRADYLQSRALRNMAEMNTPSTPVLESVYFVESHRSFGVQLADTVAYLLRRHVTHPDKPVPASSHLIDGMNLRFEDYTDDWTVVSGGWGGWNDWGE